MRSCLHSLLVGVLAFSMSVDVASACGHLRRWRCPPPCVPATLVAPGPCGSIVDACGVPVADCGCGGPIAVAVWAGCEVISCGTPLDGGMETVVVSPSAAETMVTGGSPATESVVAPESAPAAPASPAPIAAVPDLEPVEPVEPVSASEPELEMPDETEPEPAPEDSPTIEEEPMEEQPLGEEPAADEAKPEQIVPEPAAEPAPAPEPAAEPQTEPPAPPRNIFEEDEADEVGADQPDSPAEPAMEEAPVEPALDEGVPAAEPPADEAPVDPQPSEPEPAAEPVAEPEVDPVAEPEAALEPLRRWIDGTASFTVTGRLVAVHGERVEILRPDGRTAVLPLARLSGFDREYVAEAAVRLAASRRQVPQTTDTASR